MSYNKLKNTLSDPEVLKQESFSVLREISGLVNFKDTHDKGRDLVIRALAQLEHFPEPEKEILFSLVRSVGLFPYMTGNLDFSSLEDLIAYELHRADTLGTEVVFHSLQAKIFHQILSGTNVVLTAKTSVGKSLVVDAVLASGKFQKIVIVVPTLALIDETRKRLINRFGSSCAIITHPTQKPHDGKRNIYILTQERVLDRADLADIDFFVIDEFYKVNYDAEPNQERALDLNRAFHMLAKTGAQYYLLGPNVQKIRGLEKYGDYHSIPSDFSTVAVDIISLNLPTRGDERLESLVELCKTKLSGPTIIYCQGPTSASKVAKHLLDNIDLPEIEGIESAIDWVSENFDSGWIVGEALSKGIGIHHGGVPRALQQYFIQQFNDRKLKFLVCTSTIIEGVNTVAENVVIFDRRKRKSVIDHFTYKNIIGRAGRMSKYFIGKVYVLESPPDEQDYSVEFPIGTQSSETPINLLIGLDKEDLTLESKDRLQRALSQSSLKADTLEKNKHLPFDVQERIANSIRLNIDDYRETLVWTRLPKKENLRAVCQLIYDHLEGPSLKELGIFAGNSLYWHLFALQRNRKDLRGYLAECIANPPRSNANPDSVLPASDVIDNSLKFIRNIVCHRFPRDLMAIDTIQRDLFGQKGYATSGNYAFYAESVKNLFMHPTLFALDEYGLPIQTVQKLSPILKPADTLDEVLDYIASLPLNSLSLTKFELDLVKGLQSTIIL